jgi:hypothetical protein
MSTLRIDLHTHSTASDGSDTPSELVRKAAACPLSVLALTDHDTLDGLDEASQEAKQQGVIFVRGCEISTSTPWGEAHFLGLWIPLQTEELAYTLDAIRKKRLDRNLRIAEKLRGLGFPICYEDAAALSGGKVVGRPHFAELLCRMGITESRKEAFQRYLGEGGLAYEPRKLLNPQDAVALLKRAGALVSMAHPKLLRVPHRQLEELIKTLKPLGLDALEVYHSEHNAGDIRECIDLVNKYDLQITGGSDYHGISKPQVFLGKGKGSLRVGIHIYEALMEYRKNNAKFFDK